MGPIKLKEVKSLIDKYKNIPDYLKDKARFCLWKSEVGKGKVPYQVNGKRAKANNISTFTNFKDALSVVNKFDGLGIGIFNKISAIDIDNCIDEKGKYSDSEKEQKRLKSKVELLSKNLESAKDQALNTDNFLKLVKKYTEIKKLDAEIIRKFADKIIVFKVEKVNGKRQQKIRTYYNCIGAIDIPSKECKTA